MPFLLGELVCWGSNNDGQSSVPNGSYTQVVADYNHTCALTDSSMVRCWGGNGVGQASAPNVEYIQITGQCGLDEVGIVSCWGFDVDNNTFRNFNLPNQGSYIQISADWSQLCGLRSNGSIDCWSYYTSSISNPETIWHPPAGHFVHISVGTAGYAVTSDSEVYGWGGNHNVPSNLSLMEW